MDRRGRCGGIMRLTSADVQNFTGIDDPGDVSIQEAAVAHSVEGVAIPD
jgi:hypothetical protein